MRRADPRLTDDFLHHLALPPGARLLDLACGTGNYTQAFADAGVAVTGLDRSALMARAAWAKGLPVCLGDAARLPFADATFDGVSCCLAIHHFEALAAPFKEAARVLKKGRLVIFTSTPEQTAAFWLKEYFPAMIEQAAAVMPPLAAIEMALRAVDFRVRPYETWDVPADLIDNFMYSGKHRPHLYLDPAIRAGSSGFRRFMTDEELLHGLARLERDIATGRIDHVIRAHTTEIGDYGFIVAEKT